MKMSGAQRDDVSELSSGLSSEQAHKNLISKEVGWEVRTIHSIISISFFGHTSAMVVKSFEFFRRR